MVEPTKPGFTDVVWDAREPEQLARDLVSGAGAVPAAEAGLAWARLSAGFGAAAIEYERILATLDTAWESQNSRAFIERIRALRDWFIESSTAAAGNAVKAETHAAAYEIARLAMPDAGEVEQIRDLQKLLQTVGAAIGAPMLSQVAKADEDADAAKAVAARVMRTYEATTEPLATPWEHQAAPTVTAGLEALTQPAPAAEPASAETPQVSGAVPQLSIGPINIPRVLTTLPARRHPGHHDRDRGKGHCATGYGPGFLVDAHGASDRRALAGRRRTHPALRARRCAGLRGRARARLGNAGGARRARWRRPECAADTGHRVQCREHRRGTGSASRTRR
ncbi:PPE domain-containing protein [Nocardia inohanensis]|uniref:PPE domain-containing protein n=1 Tax=Nocardia inohanensis TaxID=209246 RepID=UPI000A05690A|nr:PPE domain-containing protein [Nocardia inohanensis]